MGSLGRPAGGGTSPTGVSSGRLNRARFPLVLPAPLSKKWGAKLAWTRKARGRREFAPRPRSARRGTAGGPVSFGDPGSPPPTSWGAHDLGRRETGHCPTPALAVQAGARLREGRWPPGVASGWTPRPALPRPGPVASAPDCALGIPRALASPPPGTHPGRSAAAPGSRRPAGRAPCLQRAPRTPRAEGRLAAWAPPRTQRQVWGGRGHAGSHAHGDHAPSESPEAGSRGSRPETQLGGAEGCRSRRLEDRASRSRVPPG